MAQSILIQNEENRRAIASMTKEMEENRASILKLDQKSVDIQEELSIVQEKISEFSVIKQLLKVIIE